MIYSGNLSLGRNVSPLEWVIGWFTQLTAGHSSDLRGPPAGAITILQGSTSGLSFLPIPGADPNSITMTLNGSNLNFTDGVLPGGEGTVSSITISARVNGETQTRTIQFPGPTSLDAIIGETTRSGNTSTDISDYPGLTNLLLPDGFSIWDYGTGGRDLLIGVGTDDLLFGGGGADTLKGFGGDDSMEGGARSDKLIGGGGDDTLLGGGGNDTLLGGGGNDSLLGGGGKDTLKGSNGADSIHGNGGRDKIEGGIGPDRLWGSAGNDTMKGGRGDDFLDGGGGNGFIHGGNGYDELYGGSGNDTIVGAGGDDLIIGDTGDDTLNGGAGADLFVFFDDSGTDTIEEFNPAEDVIEFDNATSLADISFQQGDGYVLVTVGNSQVYVEGVTVEQIRNDDVFGF